MLNAFIFLSAIFLFFYWKNNKGLFEEFKNKVLEEKKDFVESIVKSLYCGDVYILKGAYTKEFMKNLKVKTFLHFKNKTFDYTRISLLPFYKFDSGESVFKFDQNYENLTLNISYDQQLYGPIILKSFGTLNLTNTSNDYGEFIDSKISLNWKKRSYEVGIFYQPHNQAGGIAFSLFGFK